MPTSMTCKLSVNLNAVAMLRNRRSLPWPSVVQMARIALRSGAHGVTVHPRPDERHVRSTDVFDLATLLRAEFPGRELNVEGYPDDRFLDIVAKARPHQVTLVPDDPGQATSDHGWDFVERRAFLTPIIGRLRADGSRVSAFCDADVDAATAARATGADRIELFTGPYGACHDDPKHAAQELEKLVGAGRAAAALGMGINAGHDLTVRNLPELVTGLPELDEVSIGHGLTADALVQGMAGAVRAYLDACTGRPARGRASEPSS